MYDSIFETSLLYDKSRRIISIIEKTDTTQITYLKDTIKIYYSYIVKETCCKNELIVDKNKGLRKKCNKVIIALQNPHGSFKYLKINGVDYRCVNGKIAGLNSFIHKEEQINIYSSYQKILSENSIYGSLTYSKNYSYNLDNRIIQIYYNGSGFSGRKEFIIKYFYDENGIVLRRDFYDANSFLFIKNIFHKYDYYDDIP